MTFLSKPNTSKQYCINKHLVFTITILKLLIFISSLNASVNLSNANKNTPKSGFNGGVFYIKKSHKNISDKVLSHHNSLKKALIYSPDSNYVEIENNRSISILSQPALSFTEVAQKFQN